MPENKKIVSVVVPIFNEVGMIEEIYSRVNRVFENINDYDYELVFFDDGSTDGTRQTIEKLSLEHEKIKGVFYTRNFGYLKNTFYCVQQAKGDCAIILHADLQNPPELIPEFIKKWENGAQVVLGVKNKSHENKIMYFLRTVFYFLMIKIFGVRLVPHATEFELFDKDFINILKEFKDNNPFLRGIIIEYASKTDHVFYTQDSRKKGKSKFNIAKYYDYAICGITHYSRKLPRKAIGLSFVGFLISLLEIFLNFIPQISLMDSMSISNALIIRLMLLIFFALIVFISIIFEYIITVLDNSSRKPFVVEEKRINY